MLIASLLDVRPRCCWNTSLLDSAFSQPDGRSNSVAVYILTSSFQILCKSTAILLYRCEENIKKLLNRIFVASHSLSINFESHSSAFDKKVLLLRLLTLFLALYLASFHRPTTERTPRELRLNSPWLKSAFCWLM